MKEIDIQSLARENVKRLKPYSSARDEFEGSASVFLDANENPFPLDYNRYPDPHQKELKKAIAKLKDIDASRIFLGNGSDEAIDLLLRVFCEPGVDSIIAPQPTYGMYLVSAEINDVEIISTNLTPEFDLDADAVLNVAQPQTKMIFLCSPNNPSGNLLETNEVEKLLRSFGGIVVVDEAYIDFTESESWATKIDAFKNLVVLQTFSKAWGLAGLRLGMCFASDEIISLINKIKPPYNINGYTQSETLKCLTEKKAQKDEMVLTIREEREKLKLKLLELSSVRKVYPSDANFLLVQVSEAKKIYNALIKKGIVVRDRSNVVLCDNCLRITIGTPEENLNLIYAIRSL